jgi:pilus assembly protein Flp/PilA
MLEMIMTYARSLAKDEKGQALVEYALILALVSVLSVVALTALHTSIDGVFNAVSTALDGAV